MAIADIKLTLMTFPQRWKGTEMTLHILAAPRGNPLEPLTPGAPPFSQARLRLNALLIPGLTRLPSPLDVTDSLPLSIMPPANAEQLFNELAQTVEIDPAPPPLTPPSSNTAIKKYLMPSYQEAFPFELPKTQFAVTDRSYACALTGAIDPNRPPRPSPTRVTTWGRVLSTVLRQPIAAEALGLMYRVNITPPSPDFFIDGGWIYVVLDAQSDYAVQEIATPDLIKHYAARIPPLNSPRPLFASTLFPVRSSPGTGNYDEIFREVEEYDDGFAKIIHTFQPDRHDIHDLAGVGKDQLRPVQDAGIKIGWDDEQVVIWMNRQLTEDPRNSPTALDTPMGIRSYRVDARRVDGTNIGSWVSLVHAKGPISLRGIAIGPFNGDLGVDVTPIQLQGNKDGDYWLPSYFTSWVGTSLVLRDPILNQLADTSPSNVSPLSPVDIDVLPLRYGRTYEFRVRLADSTGGGPTVEDMSINPAPAGVGRCDFRRSVPPTIVKIDEPTISSDGHRVIYPIHRPLLGYPDLVFTDFPNARQALIDDVPRAKTDGREVGLPDPDVTLLLIDVAVGSLEFDPANQLGRDAPVIELYTAVRSFPSDPAATLALELDFQDAVDISLLPGANTSGALPLPTSRDIFITLTPICRPDPTTVAANIPDPVLVPHPDSAEIDRIDPRLAYFGYQAARIGMPSTIRLRVEASDEKNLLTELPGRSLQGIMLQPDPVPDGFFFAIQAVAGQQGKASTDLAQRLAQALNLNADGLTYLSQPGRRIAFGCSAALRHILAPDGSAVTFAAKADLTGHWIMVLQVHLARDWTWDGLSDAGFEITREIKGVRETVGSLTLPRAVNAVVVRKDAVVDRSGTDLVFFDAIDPKPFIGEFPSEITATYTITARFRQASVISDEPLHKQIKLPIAARPAQTPRIVSAGIALSPYQHDDAYSKTERRQRMLWFEFAEPIENPKDAYFVRVLAHAVDPMLTRVSPEAPPGPNEPPLSIDPELIRIITPGQSDDSAGLDAMQRLIPSTSPTHFLVPLPPELTDADPELFGFFVYELRVGHAEAWSTAQGRFGLPLRITGVQHPAPVLSCQATRLAAGIVASAPFAIPISHRQSYQVDPPTTLIWILLYAQVTQVDGAERRNVLLGRAFAQFPEKNSGGRGGSQPYGSAFWDQDDIVRRLTALGLPSDSSLSVLAVELLPEPDAVYSDPLGSNLGEVRILRTSPLTPVPVICVD